jgi:hypothetical protein
VYAIENCPSFNTIAVKAVQKNEVDFQGGIRGEIQIANLLSLNKTSGDRRLDLSWLGELSVWLKDNGISGTDNGISGTGFPGQIA